MNRKHNPLVALVALLLLCAGCSGVAAAEEPESSPRFTIEPQAVDHPSFLEGALIITDTKTGVQYLYVDGTSSGGLTVLQPAPEEVTTP